MGSWADNVDFYAGLREWKEERDKPENVLIERDRLREALIDIQCRCLATSHSFKFAHKLAALADEALYPTASLVETSKP